MLNWCNKEKHSMFLRLRLWFKFLYKQNISDALHVFGFISHISLCHFQQTYVPALLRNIAKKHTTRNRSMLPLMNCTRSVCDLSRNSTTFLLIPFIAHPTHTPTFNLFWLNYLSYFAQRSAMTLLQGLYNSINNTWQ